MDKKNIIRWILDLFGALIAVYVLWSVNKINDLVESDFQQGVQIEALNVLLTSVSTDVKRVADTMDAMVFEQAVNNRLTQYKMRDRWTAEMQEDLQNEWYNLISKLHPDLKHSDLPPIRAIQNRYPEGDD